MELIVVEYEINDNKISMYFEVNMTVITHTPLRMIYWKAITIKIIDSQSCIELNDYNKTKRTKSFGFNFI